MGLLVAVLSIAVIALAVLLYWQADALKELRNAHVNLAAEVGKVRREKGEALGATETYLKSLNKRLVLLEIEKTAAPKPPDEPPPSRRSFASQKARAEAGARK